MADSRYVLMHKNTPVADLQLDTDTGVIRSVGHVYNALHVPVGIPVKKGVIDRSALNTWWTGRAIPASRDRIRDALRELELASTQLLGQMPGAKACPTNIGSARHQRRALGGGKLLSKRLFR